MWKQCSIITQIMAITAFRGTSHADVSRRREAGRSMEDLTDDRGTGSRRSTSPASSIYLMVPAFRRRWSATQEPHGMVRTSRYCPERDWYCMVILKLRLDCKGRTSSIQATEQMELVQGNLSCIEIYRIHHCRCCCRQSGIPISHPNFSQSANHSHPISEHDVYAVRLPISSIIFLQPQIPETPRLFQKHLDPISGNSWEGNKFMTGFAEAINDSYQIPRAPS